MFMLLMFNGEVYPEGYSSYLNIETERQIF